jgi:hypothetical protein
MESFWKKTFHQSVILGMFIIIIIIIIFSHLHAITKHIRHVDPDRPRGKKAAAFIRQYVALTGFDLEFFNKTLEGLARVHRLFGDVLPAKNLEPLQLVSINGLAALACHTRYFTPRRLCLSAVQQPFSPGVDPNGDLENLKGDTYVHTEDNVVQYLGKKKKDNGPSYVNC